jgi:hypothetical protein
MDDNKGVAVIASDTGSWEDRLYIALGHIEAFGSVAYKDVVDLLIEEDPILAANNRSAINHYMGDGYV